MERDGARADDEHVQQLEGEEAERHAVHAAEPEICGVSSPLRSSRWLVAVDAVSIDLVRQKAEAAMM